MQCTNHMQYALTWLYELLLVTIHMDHCSISFNAGMQLAYNLFIFFSTSTGSDCWAMSKMDARKIDALDQWCLRMLLGIRWYQSVRNDDVRRLTKQPKLTAIIQSCRLTLFGHIMTTTQMPRGSCWTPLRQSPHHVAQHHPTGSETSPSYAPRSSRFGSELPSVEDDVDVWRYAIMRCTPETTKNTGTHMLPGITEIKAF